MTSLGRAPAPDRRMGIDSTSLYGTLNLLILKALAGGALHGLAIARSIQEETEEVLKVEEGALYPALHRLEREGLLESQWGASEHNRRARFYRLTPAGRRRLERETSDWVQHMRAVSRLLGVRVAESG